MSEIIIKDPIYKDPFEQSDRGGFGPRNGKGDVNRSVGTKFARGYDAINWPKIPKRPGKTTYRYK